MNNIREQLVCVVEELGLNTDEMGNFINLDSFGFLAMIIRIEETFNIVFPDEFLMISLINSIDKIEKIIINILGDEVYK